MPIGCTSPRREEIVVDAERKRKNIRYGGRRTSIDSAPLCYKPLLVLTPISPSFTHPCRSTEYVDVSLCGRWALEDNRLMGRLLWRGVLCLLCRLWGSSAQAKLSSSGSQASRVHVYDSWCPMWKGRNTVFVVLVRSWVFHLVRLAHVASAWQKNSAVMRL